MKIRVTKKGKKKIKKSIKKIGIILFSLFLLLSLGKIQGTNSAYNDLETSAGNNFEAAELDFDLSASAGLDADGLKAGENVSGGTTVENNGSIDFQYNIYFSKTSGDNDLCAALQLEAKKGATVEYSSSLSGFNFDAGDLGSSDDDAWTFKATLPAGSPESLENENCNFSFIFTAWQTNLPDASSGFSDSESLTGNEIASGDWTGPEISGLDNSDPQSTKGSANDNMAVVDIAWITDENATSNVAYGTSSHADCSSYSSGAPVPADASANNTSHSVRLENLTAGTTYYYRVESSDAAGNSTCSEEEHFTVFRSTDSPTSDVVLNEFVPRPSDDSADMPDGEWVELYNKGATEADVTGWFVYDSTNANGVQITTLNTEPAATAIPPHGYLVVYIQKAYFNNDGDAVRLYSGLSGVGTLVDSHAYAGLVPENKSFARFPDGVGVWIDPESTPGEKNELNSEEKGIFFKQTLAACFDGEGKTKKSREDICKAEFLVYLGMLDGKKDKAMSKSMKTRLLIKASLDSRSAESLPGDESGEGNNFEKITKKVPVRMEGKPDAVSDLKLKTDLMIKKVDLKGNFDGKEIIIDLAKLGKIEKKGEIKVKIKELDLPDGVRVVKPKKNKVVLLITVEEKNDANQKNSKKKGGKSRIKLEAQASLPKTDLVDNSADKKGGDGTAGDGDPNNQNKNPIP